MYIVPVEINTTQTPLWSLQIGQQNKGSSMIFPNEIVMSF